jgi:hypothetical protein
MIGPRPLRIRCDLCKAGLVGRAHSPTHPAHIWPERCPFCAGRGSLSLERVCEKIGENVSTVRKLLRPKARMRAKVAHRILLNLDKWLHPRQPELLR